MKTFKDTIMEVMQPLSQGEKNFKALHNPVNYKGLVPGVTDQDHVFNGLPRREDPKSASYENFRDDDESTEAYDKDTQVTKIAPEKDKDMKEDTVLEKTLTPAEMKKREEIAKAMGKSNPAMPMGKKMAIATAMAKKVAEEVDLNEALGDHASLAKYADEHGRIDKEDLHTAAKHIKSGNMNALKKHLEDMDTDPRDKALEYINKKHYEKLGYRSEEVEHLDELTGIKTSPLKKMGYVMKAGKRMTKTAPHEIANNPTTARKFTNTLKTLKKMNKEEVELDEAKRGRPSKNASADGEEGGREHIIVQLRKAENLRGSEKKVEFNDNSKHSLDPAHVKKALNMHSGMKPMEKGDFEKRLAASHSSFMSAVKGEAAPKPKPKISLGGMKKEEADPSTTRADRGAMGTTLRRDSEGVLRVSKHKGHSKGINIGEALDPVGKEDGDVDNNGKVNKSDKFLKFRRKMISKAIAMKEAEEMTSATVKAAADTQLAKGQTAKENMQQVSLDKFKKDPLACADEIATLPPTQGNDPIGGDESASARVSGKYSMEEEKLTNLYNSLSEENKEKFESMIETDEGFDMLLDFAEKQGF